MVRGQQINPVRVVDGKGKRRIIRIIRYSTASGEPEGQVGGGAVNKTTYWDQIPECHLADVVLQLVRRIWGLRDKSWRERRILLQTMDVTSAFRPVGVDPAGAVNFGYVLRDCLFVDLGLQFGWRGSPGW